MRCQATIPDVDAFDYLLQGELVSLEYGVFEFDAPKRADAGENGGSGSCVDSSRFLVHGIECFAVVSGRLVGLIHGA